MKCAVLIFLVVCLNGCGLSEIASQDSSDPESVASEEPVSPGSVAPRISPDAAAAAVSPDGAAAPTVQAVTDVTPAEAENLVQTRGGTIRKIEIDGEQVVWDVGLNKTGIGDAGAVYVAAFREVRNVGLTSTGMTNAGLKHLAESTSIQSLYLGENPISDEGLAHLANLVNLEKLVLSNTQVTGPGLAHLAALPNLQLIDLRQTPVDDSSLERLSGFESLQLLNLQGTGVSAAGVERLAQAIPQAAIRADQLQVKGLAGYWEITSAKIDGEPEEGLAGSFLVLRRDGTFALVRTLQLGEQPRGSWEAHGDGKLILHHAGQKTIEAEMQIQGDRLTLAYPDAGARVEETLDRRELKDEPVEYNGGIRL